MAMKAREVRERMRSAGQPLAVSYVLEAIAEEQNVLNQKFREALLILDRLIDAYINLTTASSEMRDDLMKKMRGVNNIDPKDDGPSVT